MSATRTLGAISAWSSTYATAPGQRLLILGNHDVDHTEALQQAGFAEQVHGGVVRDRAATGADAHLELPSRQRQGVSRVPRLARPARWSQPESPCASRMIPLESPVPEIGTPGSESGGRKRAHGTRTAARCESAG